MNDAVWLEIIDAGSGNTIFSKHYDHLRTMRHYIDGKALVLEEILQRDMRAWPDFPDGEYLVKHFNSKGRTTYQKYNLDDNGDIVSVIRITKVA